MFKEDRCPVCFEDIDEFLDCGHWVHEECVAKSFRAECPICRKPVDIDVQEKPHFEEDFIYEENVEEGFIYNDEVICEKSERHIELEGILSSLKNSLVYHEFLEDDIEFVEQILEQEYIQKVELKACRKTLNRIQPNFLNIAFPIS